MTKNTFAICISILFIFLLVNLLVVYVNISLNNKGSLEGFLYSVMMLAGCVLAQVVLLVGDSKQNRITTTVKKLLKYELFVVIIIILFFQFKQVFR